MNVASKDEINFGTDKPALKDSSHAFTFHIVGLVTAVDGHMHENNKPRCLLSIHTF